MNGNYGVTLNATTQRLADIAAAIPDTCYDNPAQRGLIIFERDVAIYFAALALLAATDSIAVSLLGWLLAGNAISALFVIGHDAAHGALFRSRRLNYIVGQIAMLPSLHAFSVWAYGHNRVHHAFACCQGLDFVWHPVSPQEYKSLSALGKFRHKLEWSAIGSGFYYARVIWFDRIIQSPAPARGKAEFRRDRIAVAAYLTIFLLAAATLGWAQQPTLASSAWSVFELFVVPWAIWNTIIGWTVYIHHIHPEIAWMTRRNWTKLKGHVEGTTNYTMPWWINLMWHNIFDHTAHHLDPRIPFYNLPSATKALRQEHGALVALRKYRVRDYVAITKRCKLFDFDNGMWVDYQGRPG